MQSFFRQQTVFVILAALFACTVSDVPVLGQSSSAEAESSETGAAEGRSPLESTDAAAADAESSRDLSLAERQDAIAIRFKRFENTLLQMAEYMRKTDPERADLLIRAIGRSKEDRIGYQMERIVALLESEQLGDANDQQSDLVGSLHNLLELLQSEDRRSEIEKEKQRLKDLVKNLDRLIGKEKDVRVGTQRGGDAQRLAEKQDQVADETGRLVDKIDKQDAEKQAEDADGQKQGDQSDGSRSDSPQDSSKGDQKDGSPQESDDSQKTDDDRNDQDGNDEERDDENGSQQDGNSKPGEQNAGESDQKSDESQPSESGQNDSGQQQSGEQQSGEQQSGQQQSGQQQSGQQQSGQQQSGQQQQQQEQKTPGRDDIEQARQRMKKAVEELKRLDREQAEEHQDEAVQKLVEAKEKLEEILRQLREEEQKLILAALEARFNKMLAMQLVVYHETVRLGEVDKQKRTNRHRTKSRELAFQEEAIVLEANKALTLLKEEGSSVAFPAAVEQIRDDMQLIARRLERTQVDELTQEIEKSVIETLEEVVEALQKEMEKSDEERRQQQQQQQGQPQPPPLVDVLAELKMLRSLQLRINRRTRRLGRLIDGEQATETDVLGQLRELSRRQFRLQEITHDLVTGKNQ